MKNDFALVVPPSMAKIKGSVLTIGIPI